MVRKCQNCGTPAIDEASLFCNQCGGGIVEIAESPTLVCPHCGIPAPDEQSVFCTRCGSKFEEEQKDPFPTCIQCGHRINDEHAAFCNRCGAKIGEMPSRIPVCPACGAEAPDEQTVYCNRCGTPVSKPGGSQPGSRPILQGQPSPGKVILTPRRYAAQQPVYESGVPDNSWAGPAYPGFAEQSRVVKNDKEISMITDEFSGTAAGRNYLDSHETSRKKKYNHLPLVSDELAGRYQDRDDGGPVTISSSKKYAHLPLIAEELKVKGNADMADADDATPDLFQAPQKSREKPQKKWAFNVTRR